jgi:hypothetical protein
MTSRGLPIMVCLLMVPGVWPTVPAWTADRDAVCAGRGDGGGPGCAATNSAASAIHNGGIATGIGAAIGGDAGGDPSGAAALRGGARPYSLRPIYFRRDQFKTAADCLAAANSQRLPLEVCQ